MKNRLKDARLSKGWTQPQAAAILRNIEPRIDVSMVSRYESGVCLPTEPQLSELEAVYGLARSELYDAADLDLLGLIKEAAPKLIRRGDRHKRGRVKKCYRVPKEFAGSFPPDLLEVCGYSSWQSWHDAALKRLLGEYAARKKAEKRAAG